MEEPPEPVPPHLETLPWTYAGRGRALLLALALVGLASFFAPWVHETAPELRVLTGLDLAQKLGWMWAPFVAYFVLIPLVLTRRSVHHMRGARLAVGILGALALFTVVLRVTFTPEPSPFLPVRFSWGIGLYTCLVVAIATIASATQFGGGLKDLPTMERRSAHETLH